MKFFSLNAVVKKKDLNDNESKVDRRSKKC